MFECVQLVYFGGFHCASSLNVWLRTLSLRNWNLAPEENTISCYNAFNNIVR